MIINGTDISDFGAIVQNRRSSLAGANIRQQHKGAPGAWRNIRIGRNAPNPLLLTCNGFIEASTHTLLNTAIDEFKWLTDPNSELTVRWSDMTDREWLGYRQSLDIQGFVPDWIQKARRFTLICFCADPRARDQSATSSNTSGTAPLVRTVNLGTAPHPITITITGDVSNFLVNPVVNYRDSGDVTQESFAIADTLDDTETYVINTELFTVTKNGASATSNFSGTFFDCYPSDGGSSYPPSTCSVQLTADSGDADLFQVDYRRRYW